MCRPPDILKVYFYHFHFTVLHWQDCNKYNIANVLIHATKAVTKIGFFFINDKKYGQIKHYK